jgi:hypothetical protein
MIIKLLYASVDTGFLFKSSELKSRPSAFSLLLFLFFLQPELKKGPLSINAFFDVKNQNQRINSKCPTQSLSRNPTIKPTVEYCCFKA